MQEITVEIWFQNKNYKVETEKDGKLMKNIPESCTCTRYPVWNKNFFMYITKFKYNLRIIQQKLTYKRCNK